MWISKKKPTNICIHINMHAYICMYIYLKIMHIYLKLFLLFPYTLVLEIPNHLKLIQSMWEDDHRLSTNAVKI